MIRNTDIVGLERQRQREADCGQALTCMRSKKTLERANSEVEANMTWNRLSPSFSRIRDSP